MQLLGTCRLVDVLSDWGSHNAAWRWGPVSDVAEGVEMVLISYGEMMLRIFGAEPVACLRALFDVKDISQIITHSGQPLDDLATRMQGAPHVRGMSDGTENVSGPLICTCVGDLVDGELRPRSRLLLFDGWNRGAAWVLRTRVDSTERITARIIVTKRDVPIQGQA